MEAEFREIDENGSWNAVYQEVRQQSCELPCQVAKLPENKSLNRYRDVSPFDHSRIRLQLGANDYINASLMAVEEAQRKYILTQGPLPNTCGDFWEMVWEQRSRGVVMLNRVIEKGCIKCAQYWPHRGEKDMFFKDTDLRLTLVSEDIESCYTVRQLALDNLSTQETRQILHFHYTTWPDFGVPESPASFLNFLFKVRESGCMSADQGPVVVHCSAGIGRSGTFCLVDTCLLLLSIREQPSSVRIREVLLEMRRHRMGLIQTADQLRFSYLAIIEGANYIKGDASLQESWKELSSEEDDPPEFAPPPLPPPREPYGSEETPSFFPDNDEIIQQMQIRSLRTSPASGLRQRSIGARQPPADAGRLGIQDATPDAPAESQQRKESEERESRRESEERESRRENEERESRKESEERESRRESEERESRRESEERESRRESEERESRKENEERESQKESEDRESRRESEDRSHGGRARTGSHGGRARTGSHGGRARTGSHGGRARSGSHGGRARSGSHGGERGAGVTEGERGAGVTEGERGAGVTDGERGAGVTEGERGAGVTEGERGAGVMEGERGAGVMEGERGAGVMEGERVSSAGQRVPRHGAGRRRLRLLSSLFPLMSDLPPPLPPLPLPPALHPPLPPPTALPLFSLV
ncbi:tyrosine-protein phosphatase non-receptor type 1-like [Brachionichthys hirsutus]|uniref:tyrosine-protein phosphatase non-receptor type 1-like n=1 Tax=Brachionichthys hirsutus TaxID=412623 RepID=UPI0036050FA8